MHSSYRQSQQFRHWAFSIVFGTTPTSDRTICADLWDTMRRLVPEARAAVIMPDHIHLITDALDDLSDVKRSFSIAFSKFEKRHPIRFNPISDPQIIPNAKHLLRQIRYVHLNPCRDGLCDDPLKWEWSTHLDVMGLVVNPWVTLRDLSNAVKSRLTLEGFHRYVSSDPTVKISGTPLPLEQVQSRIIGPEDLISALLLTHRLPVKALQKRGQFRTVVVHTAKELSIPTRHLHHLLSIHPRSTSRIKAAAPLVSPSARKKIEQLTHDERLLTLIRKIDVGRAIPLNVIKNHIA